MKGRVARWVVFTLLVAAIAMALLYRKQIDSAALESWIHGAGMLGPLVFIVIYALATVLFIPGSVLTLAGGALFGPVLGTLYNLTGATIGATAAFLIARYLAYELVEQKTAGRLKQLKKGVESEGWRFVAFVRLVPLFPFNLLNYALGLTRIKLWHYVVASCLCMLPGALAYTYLGYAGREAATGGEGLIQKALLSLALLAVVAYLPRWLKRRHRAPQLNVQQLKSKLEHGGNLYVLDVRTAKDFVDQQGHISQAHNIPVEDLFHRLNELSALRDRAIAIICRTEKRSKKAANLLAQKGFTDVHIVKGGMTEWNRRGYRIER